MSETLDVVQCVVKHNNRFLMGKRSSDGFWEFLGGKVEENEVLKQAAFRELREETGWNLSKNDLECFRKGDSYRSKDDERYRLNPVYLELKKGLKHSLSKENLSNEHTDLKWIKLTEFDKLDTLGQYDALEHLDIVNGRVALAVVEKKENYLIVKRSSDNSTPGKWGFVSGGIETGETALEASKRELREETGLKAKPVEKGEFFIGKGEKGFWRIEPVKMRYISGRVDLNWELSEYKWVKPRQIEDFDTIGEMKALEKLELN